MGGRCAGVATRMREGARISPSIEEAGRGTAVAKIGERK